MPSDQDAAAPPTTRRPQASRNPFRGASARVYLLLLVGQHVLGRGDRAWTGTLVAALGLVGFGETAARQALARSQAAGWLAAERSGRRTRWHLTDFGREFLERGRTRLFAAGPQRDWDGEWLLLLTTVPERHRELRHHLRTQLTWAGFGSLGQGVWISPHPSRAGEARQVLRSLGDVVQGTLLHARLDDPAERRALVAQAWDVSDLAARYKAFVERFAGVDPGCPPEALAERTHMVYEWRRFMFADPGLPPALLPPDWPGDHARRLFRDCDTRWASLADAWWEASEARNARR